ncbi:MAG: CRISPR system precrRNA processing endoribonuclease RAMP protein Cas6 [Candidatus Binataceae bacterium]
MPIDAANLPPVLPLRVMMRAAEAQFVPAFPGSALHGALGRALWKTVCAFPRRRECAGCPLFNRCAYPALFASCAPAIEGLDQLGIREQAPRPMVLAPEPGWTLPSGHPRLIAQGAEIPFRVTLIGRAIDDLPLLVVALRQMALSGIGRRPHPAANASRYARAEIARIVSEDGGGTVYDAATELLSTPSPAPPGALNHHSADGAGIEIRLVTPLRLKRDCKFQGRPSPVDFALTLARRANALAALYANDLHPIDEGEVERLAREVESEAPQTRLVHVRRYSARQGRRMEWPGVIGRLSWRGAAVDELWPLLKFGEMVQIGKGATLGFGRYVVASDDDESD